MKTLRIALPENKQNVTNYLNALKALGPETVVVSDSRVHRGSAYQQEYLDIKDLNPENYDGLILPGGWDVNPARYHQRMNGSGYVDNDLDDLQLAAVDAFVKAEKPVFGICRGFQILNVYFGGSLVQNIPTAFRHAKNSVQEEDKIHKSTTEEGSWIWELYGKEFVHNSAHHQALDRPGEGLVIDSWCSEDKVPESMHHETLPIWGVQWHPERLSLSWRREEEVNGIWVLGFFLRKCCEMSDRRTLEEYGDFWL
ncbi:MAG: gamma-glutamyl-gamma-aminobutyrate hydrolase family protein [Blautia sp.]|nr:gamma-glutamyl-gamma-aminobutyrate hydrolase family protein [Blautia sp.]